jgi:hypothetical protein
METGFTDGLPGHASAGDAGPAETVVDVVGPGEIWVVRGGRVARE